MKESKTERLERIRRDLKTFRDSIVSKPKPPKTVFINYRKEVLWHEVLDRFWGKFKRTPTLEGKLALLRKMTLVRMSNPQTYKKRRERFSRARGKFIRLFNNPCFCCGSKAQHRHHIIMLKNGGPNKIRNLMPICEWCHCQIHPFMEPQPVKEESMAETMSRVARDYRGEKSQANYRGIFWRRKEKQSTHKCGRGCVQKHPQILPGNSPPHFLGGEVLSTASLGFSRRVGDKS